MKFCENLLIFGFLFFPTFIFGLKCGAGGSCYGNTRKHLGSPFSLETKECKDACVSFKCFVENGEIMEGAGCLEDFLNTCKYTKTEIKDRIKENIGNYSIQEFDIFFTACNDMDGCATNGTDDGLWMINSTASKFGEYFKYDENLPCEFDNSEMKSLASVECESMINCESGKEYFSKSKYSHPIYGPNRTCEACMKFICTSDNGKTVNNGYGCYEDFETACNFLDSDIKEKIKRNIKDSFYYDKNYVVFSCSDSDNCQLSIDSLLPYFKVNYLSEYVLKIDKNSDKKCDKKTSTTTTFSPQIEITSSTVPNKNNDKTDKTEASEVFSPTLPSKAATQFDSLKLLKINIFGIIFIYLW